MAYYFCNKCAETIGVPTNNVLAESHDCTLCKKPYCSLCHQIGELYPYLQYMVHKQCIFCEECKTVGDMPMVKTTYDYRYVHSYDNFHITDKHSTVTHIACKRCEHCKKITQEKGEIIRCGTSNAHMYLHKQCATCAACGDNCNLDTVIEYGKLYHKHCKVCLKCINIKEYPQYIRGYVELSDGYYFKSNFNKYFNKRYNISKIDDEMYKFENNSHLFYMHHRCMLNCDKCGMLCKDGNIKIKYQYGDLRMTHCSCSDQIKELCKMCGKLIKDDDGLVGEITKEDILVLRHGIYHKTCIPLCEICKRPDISVADNGKDIDVYHGRYVHTHCLLNKAKTLLFADKDLVERIIDMCL